MTAHVYRYSLRAPGADISTLRSEVSASSTLTVAAYSDLTIIDINEDSTRLAALSDVMTTRGFTLIDTDPTTTPAEYAKSVLGIQYGTELVFGAESLGLSTTARFLAPGTRSPIATAVEDFIKVTRAGTLRNLYIYHGALSPDAVALTYTVRVNGVATAIAATVSASAAAGNDTSDTQAVAADDRVSIQASKAGVLTASPGLIRATLQFD